MRWSLGMWRWGEAERWLVYEALLPLLGVGALYLGLGGGLYAATQNKVAFKFSWKDWIDPLGWLYGGAILAVQSGIWSLNAGSPLWVTLFCFAGGAASLLFLVTALIVRGLTPKWEPPFSLTLFATILLVGILVAGYQVHNAPQLHLGKP